jgi:hypothetical protein
MRGLQSGSAAVFCLSLMLVGGGAANAQGQGVHVDPDSPAGKEYALPLDQARRDAGGGLVDGKSRGAHRAPLFGAGISSKGGLSGGGGASAGGGEGATSGSGSTAGQSGSSATPSDRAENGAQSGGGTSSRDVSAVAENGDDDGLSPGVIAILVAFGALAIGILVGLSARALRREHSSV